MFQLWFWKTRYPRQEEKKVCNFTKHKVCKFTNKTYIHFSDETHTLHL